MRQPTFEPRTQVMGRAMVVDAQGRPWWVDPERQIIAPAEVPQDDADLLRDVMRPHHD